MKYLGLVFCSWKMSLTLSDAECSTTETIHANDTVQLVPVVAKKEHGITACKEVFKNRCLT